MLSLAYGLVDSVEIEGKEYALNLSFDIVLKLSDLLEDDLPDALKITWGLELLFNGALPNMDIQEKATLLNRIIGECIQKKEDAPTVDREGNPLPVKKIKMHYSLAHDGAFIYASFWQAYGLDLIEERGRLHWHQFTALLDGLPEGTKLNRVLDIRTRKMPKGKDAAEERRRLKELQKIYALPEEGEH
ncbi:MAG: bacteriophage Gp15 family protein [Turicibacter sp.]|nr:bacteriophage Gp15 family protein [Turicibacter sp.]